MTLDEETALALSSDPSWGEQMWALAMRRSVEQHGGSTPTLDDVAARMLSCAVPGYVIGELDRIAHRRGVSRSDIVRAGLALVLHADAEHVSSGAT